MGVPKWAPNVITAVLVIVVALLAYSNFMLWYQLHTGQHDLDPTRPPNRPLPRDLINSINGINMTGATLPVDPAASASKPGHPLTADQRPSEDKRCHRYPDADVAGHDMLSHSVHVTSPDLCCAACNEHSGCALWSFSPPDGCWLKSAGTPHPKLGVTSGMACSACGKSAVAAAALGDIRPARLLKGGTAGDTSNSPPALSFVDRLLGRGGGASALGKPCAREAVDNRGNDIMGGYYNAKTADECCKACNGHPGCKIWTFTKSTCWFKSGIGSIKTKSGVLSGSRCPGCGIFPDTDRSCSDTPSPGCTSAVASAMSDAAAHVGDCKYRGSAVLPDDPADIYQRLLSETAAGGVCQIPCSQFPGKQVNMSGSIPDTAALDNRLLTIGIPSACREHSHFQFLAKRTASLAPAGTRLVCWQSRSAVHNAADKAALEGLGFAVTANTAGFPALRIPNSLGDPFQRVRWRATEALDYVNVLRAAYAEQSRYILILQDDTFVAPEFGKKLTEALETLSAMDAEFGMLSIYTGSTTKPTGVHEQEKTEVKTMYFGREGQAVALVYRREIVPELIQFISGHYLEYPVDWTIYGYIGHVRPRPLRIYAAIPNLVQHVGKISTGQHVKDSKRKHKFVSKSFSKFMAMAEIERLMAAG